MTKKSQQRSKPAIFHRLFLSHLLLLMFCFAAALILVDYLFATGVRVFLLHSTLILIPAVLALIGIAGLLALWTSGPIALPLEQITNALHGNEFKEQYDDLHRTAGCEEINTLLGSMNAHLSRTEQKQSQRPLLLVIDNLLNIHQCDIDTAARLGVIPETLLRDNLRSFLAPYENVDAISAWVHACMSGSSDCIREIHLIGAARRELFTQFHGFSLSPSRMLLVGMNIRVQRAANEHST